MEWLCPVCETINSLNISRCNEEDRQKSIRDRRFCKRCFTIRDDNRWEKHIEMNEAIDTYLPREKYEIYLSSTVVTLIHPRDCQWYNLDDTYKYIKARLRYRNTGAWKNWRRKLKYKEIVRNILEKWNKHHPHRLEYGLIMSYLL